MVTLPSSTTYLVIGAGIHGLSTAWHLSMELEARGKGSGKDIVLLDKTGPGAGATGIACGCVRNFYMTEPLHAILRHSVDVWMHDPVNFGFQQVGYISCGAADQIEDYARIHKSQNAVDYHSDLYVGNDARRFLTGIWPDFKAEPVEVALHERPSGYAGTAQVVAGMTDKCKAHGVQCHWGVEVLDYDVTAGRVSKVQTSAGDIACDAIVLAPGTWLPQHWEKLGQPSTLDLHYPNGTSAEGRDMWTYWRLREGEIYHAPPYRDARNLDPPVLHVELMNTPVLDPHTGDELADHLYVYWKNGAERIDRPGIQGGILPIELGPQASVEPYGHVNDAYQAESFFADYICAAMGQLMGRFEGCRKDFRERRNGGIGAFTPDNVPIFDWVLPNLYMIADSNHGFKMTGVGKLVAKLLAGDNRIAELEPFALNRFAAGHTFGASNSNSPWV